VSALVFFPFWKAAAIGQSGYAVGGTSYFSKYLQAMKPPWRGSMVVIGGMTWARAAIFYGSDTGKKYMTEKGYNAAVCATAPSLMMSVFAQTVNQPFVRSSIMLQNPGEPLAKKAMPNVAMLKHLVATKVCVPRRPALDPPPPPNTHTPSTNPPRLLALHTKQPHLESLANLVFALTYHAGPYFILNGNRHFLVGTGDDFGYPSEAPPMNKTVYLQRLGLMKSYGFDFIRLHSHFESPQFFEAADELGFLISPALPSGGCKEVLARTWEYQIQALRNHPSLMDVNMKNEAYGEPPAGGLGGWVSRIVHSCPHTLMIVYTHAPIAGRIIPLARGVLCKGKGFESFVTRHRHRRLLLGRDGPSQDSGTRARRWCPYLPRTLRQRLLRPLDKRLHDSIVWHHHALGLPGDVRPQI
jgi:hypothetical protein